MYLRLLLSLFLLVVLSLNNLGIISLTHRDLLAIVDVNNIILLFFVVAAITIMISLNDTDRTVLSNAVKKVEGKAVILSTFCGCLASYLFYLKMNDLETKIIALLPFFFLFFIQCVLSVIKRKLKLV